MLCDIIGQIDDYFKSIVLLKKNFRGEVLDISRLDFETAFELLSIWAMELDDINGSPIMDCGYYKIHKIF